MSLAKKEKPPEEDPYANKDQGNDWDEPVFLASATQQKRTELIITSDEEAYRRKQYPTIMERIEIQKEWAKEQLRVCV